jgi:anti-sigma regulatory factor (Ser/Thr protein kinase)
MQEVLGDDAPSDDIAILTAAVDGFPHRPPGERREWRFHSRDARTGTLVRHEIGRLIAEWTAREDAGFASELSFGELFSNAVRHAPGQIDVIATCDGRIATIEVDDGGRGFDGTVPPAEPFAETGRGLELIRALADRMTVEGAPNGGTRVTVVFGVGQRTAV